MQLGGGEGGGDILADWWLGCDWVFNGLVELTDRLILLMSFIYWQEGKEGVGLDQVRVMILLSNSVIKGPLSFQWYV